MSPRESSQRGRGTTTAVRAAATPAGLAEEWAQ